MYLVSFDFIDLQNVGVISAAPCIIFHVFFLFDILIQNLGLYVSHLRTRCLKHLMIFPLMPQNYSDRVWWLGNRWRNGEVIVQFLRGRKILNFPQHGSRKWDSPNLIHNNNGSVFFICKMASMLSWPITSGEYFHSPINLLYMILS